MTQKRKSMLDAVLEEAGLTENLTEDDRRRAEEEAIREKEAAEFKARLEAHNKGEEVDWPRQEKEKEKASAEPEDEPKEQEKEKEKEKASIEPEPEPEPETETERAEEDFVPFEERPVPEPTDTRAEVMKALKEILGVPKQRSALPTLVRFKQDGRHMWRAVIVDIGEIELQKGWELWKECMDRDGEHYLLAVYELTESEIPRMYRTVGEMRLE